MRDFDGVFFVRLSVSLSVQICLKCCLVVWLCGFFELLMIVYTVHGQLFEYCLPLIVALLRRGWRNVPISVLHCTVASLNDLPV